MENLSEKFWAKTIVARTENVEPDIIKRTVNSVSGLIINTDNYRNILCSAFTLVDRTAFDVLRSRVGGFYADIDLGDPAVDRPDMSLIDWESNDLARSGYRRVQCNSGGTFYINYGLNGSSESHVDEGLLENCRLNNDVYNGAFTGESDRYSSMVEYINYSELGVNGTFLEFSGTKRE